ncbi:MAG: hypothetical protein QOF41_167 [Methylobacteriaceae bacterium]|nr:hypothetical protein [Methylobacteriaceae bacterium]
MTELTPAYAETAVRNLVLAERTNLGIEVSTPVVYPDGDVVTVAIEETKEGLLVHDAGFASMRLSQAGIRLTRSAVLRLKEHASRYRCTFALGRVSAIADYTSLGTVSCLVANAARSVADYSLEIRQQLEADFRQILSEVLREIVGKRLRENEEVKGNSGRKYRLSAVLLDQTEAKPTNFVSAVANRHIVSPTFAMLYDLHQRYGDVEADSVYDEDADIRPEDRAFLNGVGQVYSFTEAQVRFKEIIGAPSGVA